MKGLRLVYLTRPGRQERQLDALWLDGAGHLHEWGGDDWYLFARFARGEWKVPGGLVVEGFVVRAEDEDGLVVRPALASVPPAGPSDTAGLALYLEDGAPALYSHAADNSIRSPATATLDDSGWRLADSVTRDLVVGPVAFFLAEWPPVVLSRAPRGRTSPLALSD